MILDTTKEVIEAVQKISKLLRELNIPTHETIAYVLQNLYDIRTLLYTKYVPFPIGSRVKILQEPNTDNDWKYSKHFLNKGSAGVVLDIDYFTTSQELRYNVVFDNESWIDNDGVTHPTKDKHTFSMKEHELELETGVPHV